MATFLILNIITVVRRNNELPARSPLELFPKFEALFKWYQELIPDPLYD